MSDTWVMHVYIRVHPPRSSFRSHHHYANSPIRVASESIASVYSPANLDGWHLDGAKRCACGNGYTLMASLPNKAFSHQYVAPSASDCSPGTVHGGRIQALSMAVKFLGLKFQHFLPYLGRHSSRIYTGTAQSSRNAINESAGVKFA